MPTSLENPQKTEAKKLPLISIVIATYNRADLLRQCLQSLVTQKTDLPYEIIVCDDGSKDATSEVVARFQSDHPNLITYLHQPNQGAANARNMGIGHVRGRLTAFLDDDHIASPSWLENISRLPGDPVVAGQCGRAFSLPGTNWVSRYCAFAELHEKPQLKSDGTVENMVAGNSLIRTDTLLEAGGFDTRFNAFFKGIVGGGEDTALSLNLNKRGYQILYNPDAITHQRQKDSLKSVLKENFNFGCNRVLWHYLRQRRFSFFTILWRLFRLGLTMPFMIRHIGRFRKKGARGLDCLAFPFLERVSLICYEAGTLAGILLLNRKIAQNKSVQ